MTKRTKTLLGALGAALLGLSLFVLTTPASAIGETTFRNPLLAKRRRLAGPRSLRL